MKHPILLAGIALAVVSCAPQSPIGGDNEFTNPPVSAKRAAMEWWAKNTGEDENGMPHNTLSLRVVGSGESLFETECNGTTLVEGVQDMEDSVATIQCWWAGGGDQFGVFIGDAEKATIKHRTVDEETGYGPWVDMKTL